MTAIGLLLAYFVGSIPTGYLFGKREGVNLRKVGSGSTGVTNLFRTFGWKKIGIVALATAIDIAKCAIPAAIAHWIIKSDYLTVAIILAVTIGHIFSCFLNFHGGKGVTTLGGGILLLIPWAWILLFVAAWGMFLWRNRYMSVTNLIFAPIAALLLVLFKPSAPYVVLGILAILIVYYTHRQNIVRLLQGKELKLETKDRA